MWRHCLLFAFAAAQVCGADYHLDSRAGDDSADGISAASAWKTLGRVNSHVFESGDRLLVRAGTVYRGQLKPAGSGTAGAPVKLDMYGEGPKPRIDGGGVMPATLYLFNVEHWEVRNLEITNRGEERKAGRCGVYIHLRNFGTARGIVLDSLDVHDVNGSLVKREGGGFGIKWENEAGETRSRFDGLRIENCHVWRCERNGILGASGYWKRTQWHPSTNVVIRNNLLEEIPGDGIVPLGCDGALVEYNVMRNCPRMLPEGEAAAGIWPWSCDNTVIQFNEVSGHKAPWDAQGFDADWNCRNTLIQYNYSHDNEGGFLLVCTNGGATGPDNAGNTGTVIRYNVSVNDGLRSVGKHAGFSPIFHISGPVEDTHIYNNVVYMNRKPPGDVDRTLLKMDNWGGPWPVNTRFTNNIFDTEEWTTYDYGGAVGAIFENNVYHGDHRNPPEDPRAIRDAPQFLNPGMIPAGIQALLGYRLRAGSPCIGAGMRIENNGGRDLLGVPLPDHRPPSAGALEWLDGLRRSGEGRRRPGTGR